MWMLEAVSFLFLSLQSSTIYSEPKAFPNCSVSKWTIIKLCFNSEKSTKRSRRAHNKEYLHTPVLKERVQFASAAIWKAFCSYIPDWWLLCLFQGTYVTEQIVPGNFSTEPTQICTHAPNVCPVRDACMHICHQRDLSIIRRHTHRASSKTFLQASCEYQKTWKETGSSTAIPHGPSVSGNVNLPCLHRFWWLWEQPVQLWLKLAAMKNKLVLYQFATFNKQKKPSATQHGLCPTCCSSTLCLRGGKKPAKDKSLLGLSL